MLLKLGKILGYAVITVGLAMTGLLFQAIFTGA